MTTIKLPTRQSNEQVSLDFTLEKRASCRYFKKHTLTLHDVANMLWAAQGITDKRYGNRRTEASAGASYPIELFIAVRKDGVHELDEGIYHYKVENHTLEKISDNDITDELSEASFNQEFLKKSSFSIFLASDNARTKQRYAEKGDRYVFMEAGSITQNIYLKAVARNLGTVFIGAFDDDRVKELFHIEKLMPLAIMPVGLPSDKKMYT